MSTFGKNLHVKVAHKPLGKALLTTFDVSCDKLLNRRTARWNLFVLYNKTTRIENDAI